MSDNDWDHKLKQANKFVEKGLEVKFQLMLKGRTKYMFDHDEVVKDLKDKLDKEGFKIINAWHKNSTAFAFVKKK
jgi:translation initiation factor IF-3